MKAGSKRVVALMAAGVVVAGCGMMVMMASANTVIQTIVDDEKRGRVMSFYTMSFLGTAPFGSLFAGSLSARIGAPHTVLLSGLLCLGATAWFSQELPAIRAVVRPIYIRMGILPEVASGLQTASNYLTQIERKLNPPPVNPAPQLLMINASGTLTIESGGGP